MSTHRGVPTLILSTFILWLVAVNAPADAAPGTKVPGLTSFDEMVVDPVNHHVFVDGGQSNNIVAVMNFDGSLHAVIPVLGASGMALEGGNLWVAARDANVIEKFDLATLAPLATFPTGFVTEPNNLAFAGGRVWFSYRCGWQSKGDAGIASMDPTLGIVTDYGWGFDATYCPDLASFPSRPNTLFAWDTGVSPPRFGKFNVTHAPKPRALGWGGDMGDPRQVALSGDGTRLLVAAGAPYSIVCLRTKDLSHCRPSYSTGPYPIGVAATAARGGQVAAGVIDHSFGEPDIYVFPIGSTTSVYTHRFGRKGRGVWDAGMAFSPTGRQLFVVTGALGGGVIFQVLGVN